jgi:hypothetical protein
MHSRLAIVSDGIHIRSARVGRLAYALYRRFPNLFIRHIEIEKLLLGGANWYSAATHARLTGDLLRPSTGLAASPYVQLLMAYREIGDSIFAPDRFAATSYYRHAAQCIQTYGRYFSIFDVRCILQKAKTFCQMLDGQEPGQFDVRQTGPGEPVEVRRIKFSDCYEIVDGHHRLALAFVRGFKSFPCAVLPTEGALTPMQQLVMDSVWLAGQQKLSQPISVPELQAWPIVRRCTDRLQMIMNCLARIGLSSGSFLDIGSNYGWFVSEFSKKAFQAQGVEPDAAAAAVGILAYGLDSSAIKVAELGTFLRSRQQSFDVVCCLSRLQEFVLGTETISADEFIRLVDNVTGSILFIDTAEDHERRFKSTLTGWNAEHIANWLQDHTSFSVIEVLGHDNDVYHRDQYGRHLFACIRRRGVTVP